ncbi:MAG: glycosyltransferase family 2 protein [Terriglobia bacterium]
MEGRKDIAVVLVGMNADDYLRGCLESLARTDWNGISHTVVYVDNASSDLSAANVRRQFPDVKVLENAQNQGFCKACNQGAAAVQSRYIFYLNNDTVLYPDTIPQLFDFLEKHPGTGAAGCRLFYEDLREQWSARRFPTWRNGLFGRNSALSRRFPEARIVREYLYKGQMASAHPFEVDWVPGSCTLASREAVERVGGLPEDLHYWSDAVFCDRLWRAGYKVYFVPGAKVIHFEGKGSGPRSMAWKKWHVRDFHKGAYAFYCEHYRLGRWNPARWLAAVALGLRCRLMTITVRGGNGHVRPS